MQEKRYDFTHSSLKMRDHNAKFKSKNIRFYNPREDKIPIKLVDVVITEKAWIEKEVIENERR